MEVFDVPSPHAVADDLERLVEQLDQWASLELVSLRLIPSVRARVAEEETSSSPRSLAVRLDAAVRQAVEDAISRMRHAPTRLALGKLINFADPSGDIGERMEEAGDDLGVGKEAMRKGRSQRTIRELADELYRGELWWCQRRINDLDAAEQRPYHRTWYRVIEIESATRLDRKDLRVGYLWERRRIRAVQLAQPILIFNVAHGIPTNNPAGTVKVLSGQDRGDFSHRFLGSRPADRSIEGYKAMIFDLGISLDIDEEIDLVWTETVENAADLETYPRICYNIGSLKGLDRLTLRASVPAEAVVNPICRCLKLRDSSLGIYAAPDMELVSEEPAEIEADGSLVYDVHHVFGPFQFELWWRTASP